MGVIREICDKVAVLEEGRVIEQGSVFEVFTNPQHATTKRFVRSVMNDELPDSLLEQIRLNDGTRPIYRVQFTGNSVGQPFMSRVSREFQLDLNVLFGNITELQGIPYGNLIVEFDGALPEVDRALASIRNDNIQVEEVQQHAG